MNNKNNVNTFKNSIKVPEDKEKARILKLQKQYQMGIITENEISEEDYQKLLKLYDKQNKKIEDEIEKK